MPKPRKSRCLPVVTSTSMVEQFLCPGCVCGHDTTCGKYMVSEPELGGCDGHVLGTFIMPLPGLIALGMPKGFNRPNRGEDNLHSSSKMHIRTYPATSPKPTYDVFNIPVWVREEDGFLFVRVAMPRVGDWAIDIIEGGKATDFPGVQDVTNLEYD